VLTLWDLVEPVVKKVRPLIARGQELARQKVAPPPPPRGRDSRCDRCGAVSGGDDAESGVGG
jgi:hypothetical protein